MNNCLYNCFSRRLVILPVLLFFYAVTLRAQTTQTIDYTIEDGLPSNAVYRTLIDMRGFLWVATENGLARFDGKKFRNYTTSDGLTDNEVIDMTIDNAGTIWAIPFRGKVSYYNAVSDRFESEETQTYLRNLRAFSPFRPIRLSHGGIMLFSNSNSMYLLRAKTPVAIDIGLRSRGPLPISIFEYNQDAFVTVSADSFYFIKNNKYDYTKTIPAKKQLTFAETKKNILYASFSNGIIKYAVSPDGSITALAEKTYPFELTRFSIAGNALAATSQSGTSYIIDENTLEIREEIFGNFSARHIMQDYEGNLWISTLSEGLVKIQVKRISGFENAKLQQNFTSVYKSGFIYLGNNNGEVLRFDGLYNLQNVTNKGKVRSDATVRKIIPLGNNLFAAIQSGSVIFNKQGTIVRSFNTAANNHSSKAVAVLNDSVLLLGAHSQAFKWNWQTNRSTDSIVKRIVSIGVNKTGTIYIGSNDGLYFWNGNRRLDSAGSNRRGLTYRVNALITTEDNLTWIGLATDSLIVMQDKKVITAISLGKLIPGNICKSLFSNRPGEIWLGTNEGLNRIRYQLANGLLEYSNTYFGVSDGLAGRQVNDIYIEDSVVYAATSSGLSYLPANLQLPVTDIATFITGVSVNNQVMPLQESYELDYDQNNLIVTFSGVDLTGFQPVFEYSLNNGPWQQVELVDLKNLPPDNYRVRIRALRRDGKPSDRMAEVHFNIRAPFWKKPLFWFLLALTVFGIILYLQQLRSRRKQQTAIDKITTEKRIAELEMQALKAQINPHFVFNCLNSIKGFIYDMDFAQADKYLDKFSSLMRSTIDNSDAAIISLKAEISYLDNYLQLEKLRFAEKFSYHIEVPDTLDAESVFVPAMLLQPYVENAIRHGMRFLENRKGVIRISAHREADQLICMIDDNGIGREKATLLKSRAHMEYQSKGMSISRRRAELYHIDQQIIDKRNAAGEATGTTIIVKIPINLKP